MLCIKIYSKPGISTLWRSQKFVTRFLPLVSALKHWNMNKLLEYFEELFYSNIFRKKIATYFEKLFYNPTVFGKPFPTTWKKQAHAEEELDIDKESCCASSDRNIDKESCS